MFPVRTWTVFSVRLACFSNKGVDPDTKVGGTATQREVLEGQTGSSEGGSGGPPLENFENLHGKWCNLRYS